MIDMTKTLTPKSDQLNGDDLVGGPRTFTITAIREAAPGSEQPIEIVLAEFLKGRPYKPCLSMRRVLTNGWGKDGETYVGKRFTLYRDAAVRFGGMDVGGIRISHMSDLPKGRALKSALTVTRGKKETYVVEPLPDAPAEPTPTELAAQIATALKDATTEAEVREWGNRAHGRSLLDVIVDGETVRNIVTHRLAELADKPDADTPIAEPTP